jgi:ubiquinone biosynthesis protein UbiJ
MLFAALTTTLETAFNTWLQLDAQTHGTALSQLQALQGKLVCLHISNPDLHLYFLPTRDSVHVTTEYAAAPDVTIHGSALALMRLPNAEDTGKAMLENGIRLEGDMGLGNRFSQILREVDIDWEELLSRSVGDILAHQMGQVVRNAKGWLHDTAHAMRLNTQEYLQEESRVVPADAELRQYLDAVDTLRMDTDRLEARLKRLEASHSVNGS